MESVGDIFGDIIQQDGTKEHKGVPQLKIFYILLIVSLIKWTCN